MIASASCLSLIVNCLFVRTEIMKPNYWKLGTILLSAFILVGAVLVLFGGKLVGLYTTVLGGETEISGEVFLVTKGGSNVKIGLAEIKLQNRKTDEIFKTTTNADGRFTLKAPYGEYILTANGSRSYRLVKGDEILDPSPMSQPKKLEYTSSYLPDISMRELVIAVADSSKSLVSEFCTWQIDLDLKQAKSQVQLSNNNIWGFGLKE